MMDERRAMTEEPTERAPFNREQAVLNYNKSEMPEVFFMQCNHIIIYIYSYPAWFYL